MENTPQRISVRIGGMSYNLLSAEPESYTRQVAARADEMIRRVASSNPQLSQQMTTVLALTNAVDESMRLSRQQVLAEQQRDTAELKSSELRQELARERELNWELKKELLHLRSLIKEQTPPKPADATPPVDPEREPLSEETTAVSVETEPPETEPAIIPADNETPVAAAPPATKPRPFGGLHQTGLEEYLAAFSHSESYSLENPLDDEP